MASLQSFTSSLRKEADTNRLSLASQSHVPSTSQASVLDDGQLRSLDINNRQLDIMLSGITDMSKEILANVDKLKTRKHNIDSLINVLTSSCQAKKLVNDLDKYDDACSIDNIKKFVIELHYSLANVPKKYFAVELDRYEDFKHKMSQHLRSRLDSSMESQKLSEVNSIVTLMSILGIDYDLNKKFENVLASNIKDKVAEVEAGIDKKMKSFGSLLKCIGSDSQARTMEAENQTTYPEIFFNGVIDVLTIMYDSLFSLKESSFVMDSEATFKKLLSLLFDTLLADFIKRIRSKMSAFFGVNEVEYATRQGEVSIVIERQDSPRKSFSPNQKDELLILNYYLLETMNIASQLKLFSDEIAKELTSIAESSSLRSALQAEQWRERETRRLMASYSFNAEGLEMMAYYKVIQEKVWKARLAMILSNSRSLRVLFHGTPSEISQFLEGGTGDGSKSESSSSKDTSSAYDYIDEVFYVLNSGISRAIRSLDKVTSCTLINFAGNTLLCNDLCKLLKQLAHRYIFLADGDSDGLYLSTDDSGFNKGACATLNCIDVVQDFSSKLGSQLIDGANLQFEANGDPADLEVILESCKTLEGQTKRVFHDLLTASMKSLVQGLLKGGLTTILQAYSTFDFILTEKTFREMETFPTKWSIAIRLEKRIKGTSDLWRSTFRPEVYELFAIEFANAVASHLMSVILKKKFNSLGALFLDKEMRHLLTAMQEEFDQSLSKTFAKLTATTEVLMADSKEEAYSFSKKSLTDSEIDHLLTLRDSII